MRTKADAAEAATRELAELARNSRAQREALAARQDREAGGYGADGTGSGYGSAGLGDADELWPYREGASISLAVAEAVAEDVARETAAEARRRQALGELGPAEALAEARFDRATGEGRR